MVLAGVRCYKGKKMLFDLKYMWYIIFYWIVCYIAVVLYRNKGAALKKYYRYNIDIESFHIALLFYYIMIDILKWPLT